MSLFQRIKTAATNITTALYNAGVQLYVNLVGKSSQPDKAIEHLSTMPIEHLSTIPTDTIDQPINPSTEQLSISDGSDVNLDFTTMDNDQILESISSELDSLTFISGQYYILTINFESGEDKNLILTADNLLKIKAKIQKALDGVFKVETKSDKIVYAIINNEPISAHFYSKHQQSVLNVEWIEHSGGLFLYRHNITNPYISNLLEQLEIYHTDSQCKPDVCFLSSIKGQVPDETFAAIAKKINCKRVTTSTIKKLCKEFKFRIRVIYSKLQNGKTKTQSDPYTYYGDSGPKIEIALMDDHYFKYFTLPKENKDDWNQYAPSTEGKSSTTLTLVRNLLKNKDKYLTPLNETQQFYYREPSKEFIGVNDIEAHTRTVEIPEPKGKFDLPIIYFDFETSTKGNHSVYHLSFGIDHQKNFTIGRINNRPADEIINTYLSAIADKYGKENDHTRKPNVLMLAHNATYDTSFILPYLYNIEMCEKDGRYVSISGKYRYFSKVVKIHIKDTLRLIPSGLAKFGKMFHLDQGKEVMYYNMYNPTTLKYIKSVPLEEVKSYIKDFNSKSLLSKSKLDANEAVFWQNVRKWNCYNGATKDQYVNLLEYSATYCDIDIKVLRSGLNKFREIYQKIHPDIDPINYYSLPSIANDLLLRSGCYEDTYELDGMLGDYFQPFIVGGRTMSSDNQKHEINEESIAVDYNSLYPSAMKEFDGFLKGRPILLEEDQLTMEFLTSVSHYFIEILITKIGVHRSMPLMSRLNPLDNTRQWDDKVMTGEKMKVDRYALEDLIKYQKVEFEILNGYYFNEGFNTNVNELMERLYLGRIADRAEGNESLAECKKLTMNSSYGKTIQKPNTENKVIIDTNKFNKTTKKYEQNTKVLDEYIGRHYNRIVDYRNISNIHGSSGKYLLTERVSLIDSWNKAHQGAMILSYSKRLMNMSICLLEDLGMKCFYQDTDSIHMLKRDYDRFMTEFEHTYGFNLSGDLQGQAKVDLDIFCKCDKCVALALSKIKCEKGNANDCDICRPKADQGSKCVDRVIVRSIVCGKKSYYDKMEGRCKFTGKLVKYEKGKLKGIPQDSIDAYIKDHNGKSKVELVEMAKRYGHPEDKWNKYADIHYTDGEFTLERLYEILYMGHFAVRFDLSVNNRCRFDKSASQVFSSGKPMVRRVWFVNRTPCKYEKQMYWMNGEPPIKQMADSESE